jgi:arylsulfatase
MDAPRRIAATLVLGLVGACGEHAPLTPAARVILITCDTLRADHLGCYGYARPTSPNLDRLASEATVYEDAWSAAPLTGPALSSMLAGRLPDEIGVSASNRELMSAEVVTLAEIARDAGVTTAAFVSNGVLRRAPAQQGDIGVQQGFQLFDDALHQKELNRALLERPADDTTNAVLAWLDHSGVDDPFFLWVHFQDPHGPYTPPPEHLAPFARDPASEPELPAGTSQGGRGQIPHYQLVGAERRPGPYVDRYDAEIRFFDAELGRLLDGLRARGLYEDSLIVFTADHGESLGEHGYWFSHGEHLHGELVRVPLIVRRPARTRPRSAGTPSPDGAERIDRLVMHLDLWPTLVEALSLAAPGNRGVSLLGAPLPDGRLAPQFLGALRHPGRRLSVTDGRWRAILAAGEPPQLFDRRADAGEADDVAARHADVLGDLGARFEDFMASDDRPWSTGVLRELDEPTRRGLAGLGYADDEGEGE